LGQVSFSKELEQAEFWSDFNKLYYHPKTMVEMNQICHGNETNALSSFDQGMEYMGQQVLIPIGLFLGRFDRGR
jgi:hypothetical protein